MSSSFFEIRVEIRNGHAGTRFFPEKDFEIVWGASRAVYGI
jgi:hypothetical protein